jgi:tetratricopeptide (TPR) repeat protein
MSGIRTTVRWPAFVVAGAFLLALVGTAIFILMPDRKPLAGYVPLSPSASAAIARAQRASVVADVAPAPLPTALPLLGGDGVDEDGYPKAYVDRPALRSLLWQGKFADLDRWFAELQDAFEKDPRKEYWPLDAAEAFGSAEALLEPQLDAWVKASPGSFAPWFARSAHRLDRAIAMRGFAYAKDTPRQNFQEMEMELDLFFEDAERALALRPKLVAEMRLEIWALNQSAQPAERDAMFEKAISACPACFQVRVAEMFGLMPRWGGSAARMRASAARCDVAKNPRCRFLEGIVDWDESTQEKDHQRALAAIDRALSHGHYSLFLVRRAELLTATKDYESAVADCDEAKRQRPGDPETLAPCIEPRWWLKHYEDAARDMLTILRTDPTNEEVRPLYDGVSKNVAWAANEEKKQGQIESALRLFELALDLAPSQPAYVFARSDLKYGPSREVSSLEDNVAKNPDDLRAHQALDYTLAKQGKFDRVIEIWTAYLARHPDDARALFERSGAYYHLQRWAECRADDQRACDLGISEACGQLQSLPK